jgi:hypothetical protein
METTADTRDRQSDSELLFTSWELVVYRLDSFVRVRLSTYSMLAERQARRLWATVEKPISMTSVHAFL